MNLMDDTAQSLQSGVNMGAELRQSRETTEGFLFDITLPEIFPYKVCYLYLNKTKTTDHVHHLSLEMLQA